MDQGRRIDALSRRIDKIQAGLSSRLDEINNRLDGLSKFNVRRDEYEHLAARVRRLELEVEELKRRVGI
jgi:polyhydroxyalkanoate synthesis regulator phasin